MGSLVLIAKWLLVMIPVSLTLGIARDSIESGKETE